MRNSYMLAAIILILASAASADSFARPGADETPFTPNDEYFPYKASSPLHPGQWNLVNQAPSSIHYPASTAPNGHTTAEVTIENAGLDMRVLPAWQLGYTGRNIVIGILDDGIELNHPDLNVVKDLSVGMDKNGLVAGEHGAHSKDDDCHGTTVAGMAAAVGGNGIGVAGSAPLARVASVRVNIFDSLDDYWMHAPAVYWQAGLGWEHGMKSPDLERLTSLRERPVISVKNSSSKAANFDYPAFYSNTYSAFARTSSNGMIFCHAAGNCRGTRQQDVNVNMEAASPYVITIAALGSNGKYALYSTFGSAVAATVLSESAWWNPLEIEGDHSYANGLGVSSTDRFGELGTNYSANGAVYLPDIGDLDYTGQFDGTSASAPSFAGIAALAKQANPNLNVRMTKHLLARTARVVDSNDASSSSSWSAGNIRQSGWRRNSAGFYFNPNYGFGLVDAGALVEKAIETAFVTAETLYSTGLKKADKALPPDKTTVVTEKVRISVPRSKKQSLESVEVYLKISGADRSDFQVIVSRGSTSSRLWTASSDLKNPYHPMFGDLDPAGGIDHAFLTHAFWGEDPDGEWKITVTNPGKHAGVLEDWGIVLHMGDLIFDKAGTRRLRKSVHTAGFTKNRLSSKFEITPGKTLYSAGDVLINGGKVRVNGKISRQKEMIVSKLDTTMKSTSEKLRVSRGIQVRVEGGTLTGTGIINAPPGTDGKGGVINSAGVIRPGRSGRGGTLTLRAPYTQTDGTLWIDVLGGNRYGKLRVYSRASFGGALRVFTHRHVRIKEGTRLSRVLRADSLHGNFRIVRAGIPGTNLHWKLVRRGNTIDLVAATKKTAARILSGRYCRTPLN